jgi:hypothetical protein
MPDHSSEQSITEVDCEVSPQPGSSVSVLLDSSEKRTTLALAVMLIISVAVWFAAIRMPLWLDETVSYFQIAGGFDQIWPRQGLSFPAYFYILWATKSLFGSSPYVLRAPSIFAMLAAAYLMFRIARELFDTHTALIVTIVFCLHPLVAFASIDARPYAFSVLLTNCAILCLLRWVRTHQTRYAVLTGVSSGLILYFQYLFAVILPCFAILVIARRVKWRSFWAQCSYALVAFSITLIPAISRFFYLFDSRGAHVFGIEPTSEQFLATVAPWFILPLFALALLLSSAVPKLSRSADESLEKTVICLALAFVPLLILFESSRLTPLHIFVERYRLVAIPGIALCWGLMVRQLDPKIIRVAFCLALTVLVTQKQFGNPRHGYSWRDAVQEVNRISTSNTPVLVCSDLPESDFEPLPADATQSSFFSPFSYYKLNSTIVPLPRSLNQAAKDQVAKFLAGTAPNHPRFLLMAFGPSWDTMAYVSEQAKDSYFAHPLGLYDGIAVVEFLPRQFALRDSSR